MSKISVSPKPTVWSNPKIILPLNVETLFVISIAIATLPSSSGETSFIVQTLLLGSLSPAANSTTTFWIGLADFKTLNLTISFEYSFVVSYFATKASQTCHSFSVVAPVNDNL